MRQHIKTLADLGKIKGGLLEALFQTEMRRVTQDLIDRPGLDNYRKVCLELSVAPICGQSGHLESTKARWEVSSKVPKQCTDEMSMLCDGEGCLTYNDYSPQDVHQNTLDEMTDK